jgi:hypothetical protein
MAILILMSTLVDTDYQKVENKYLDKNRIITHIGWCGVKAESLDIEILKIN